MNGINRIGQQVVCINADWTMLTPKQDQALRNAGCSSLPQLNGVYTVHGFNVEADPRYVYIELKEFFLEHGFICFNINRFRPLNPKSKHVEDMIKKFTNEKLKV